MEDEDVRGREAIICLNCPLALELVNCLGHVCCGQF